MTNTLENNTFDTNFKESIFNNSTYIDKGKENWNWTFSKKDSNHNILYIIVFTLVIVSFFVVL